MHRYKKCNDWWLGHVFTPKYLIRGAIETPYYYLLSGVAFCLTLIKYRTSGTRQVLQDSQTVTVARQTVASNPHGFKARRTVDWLNSVYRDSCNVCHDICGRINIYALYRTLHVLE